MARDKKKKSKGGGAAWLITFSDMMTLMLTFFVLLVSMATLDERRRMVVLGSIIGTFGPGPAGMDMRSISDKRRTVEPGPMNDIQDLEPLKNILWEDLQQDIDFQSNKYVQIISINGDVLFEPGKAVLSPKGYQIINLLLPAFFQIDYPLLIAGHTSTSREEFGKDHKIATQPEFRDFSWRLSFDRILCVYKYLLERGVNPDKLRLEAFGAYKPKYSNKTPAGRKKNRRVDIVLDRRNKDWIKTLERVRKPGQGDEDSYIFRDFIFDLKRP